jgi:ribonucleoside-diphosphate reductase alpha chain
MRGIDPLQGKRFMVLKRDGRIDEFNEARIFLAIESAFKAHFSVGRDTSLPAPAQAVVKSCAEKVVERVLSRAVRGEELDVERIQDAVEDQLMLAGHLEVARRYILYREQRRQARARREGRGVTDSGTDGAAPAGPPRVGTSPLEKNSPSGRLRGIYSQAVPNLRPGDTLEEAGRRHFDGYLNEGDYLRCLSPGLLEFDSDLLARGLRWDRDTRFAPAGLEALYNDYLQHESGRRIETPQYFWMRIAMGLALGEGGDAEARALEYYEALSTFRFVPSEWILRGAGTPHPYLSASCEVSAGAAAENIAGASRAGIMTDGHSGPTRSWLPVWDRDVFNFLAQPHTDGGFNRELWIPDVFMKRVRQQGQWTLLDVAEAGELPCQSGAFEPRYLALEQKAARGQLRSSQRVNALDLWHGIMNSLLRTGQPWLVFTDAVNIRSTQNQDGAGCQVSLGGEILLPGWPAAVPACPVGAINLAAHTADKGLDVALLRETVRTAVRMLDNAVDLSLHGSSLEREASLNLRPIGLGIVGFQDALDRLNIPYANARAAALADWSMELVSYYAIMASARLARDRGPYPGFSESRWREGLLPLDTLSLLWKERGLQPESAVSPTQDWDLIRALIRQHGMRNCATTALSSLAGPARLVGVAPSIEPEPASGEIGLLWQIQCAAQCQKWIDMGQRVSLCLSEADIAKLSHLYMLAWEKGLKTTHQFCPLRGMPYTGSGTVKPPAKIESEAVPAGR